MLRFLLLLFAGFAAAATIGKLVPHVPWIARELGVSLAAAGFAVSAVMLPGALLGPLVGLAADRLGARRVALAGIVLQALASAAAGWAGSFAALVAARVIEGLGYSLAIVSATVLVVQGASRERQALALAVWSAFAPVGFALGQLAAAPVSAPNPLPWIGIAHALVLGACALLVATLVQEAPKRTGPPPAFLAALRFAPAIRTAFAFGLATAALLGAVALAPIALAATHGMSVATTAQWTALAALPGIAGRFASGWLLAAAARPIAVFAIASVTGAAALAGSLASFMPFAAALVCFSVFQICIGALPGLMSAMLPRVAPSPGQLGTVSGLANQMVTTGNLLAPPLVLGMYAFGGTWAAAAALVGAVALSAALVAGLRVYRQPLGRLTPP